jgi:hypothetical protein
MKRLFGGLLVSGLLSTGIALAAAGPSSALPRDHCQDATNWWEQASWLSQWADHAWDVYTAWENATYEYDAANNQNIYTAHEGGENVVIIGSVNYQHQLYQTYADWTVASNNAIYFYDNVEIC